MAWANAMKEHLPGSVAPGLSSCTTDPPKGVKKRSQQCMRKNEVEDDDLTEKKRRLTVEQVNFLETSFNMDVKLEPERKTLLAKELGVPPRQVAIWFQNRRARWKNKQIEQDYEMLKASYEAVEKEKESLIKDYEAALEENKRWQAEVERLTSLLQTNKKDNNPTRTDDDTELPPTNEEESSRNKSELMSPTKSVVDEGSEIEAVIPSDDGADGATTSACIVKELDSSAMACAGGGKHEDGDSAPWLPSYAVVSSLPELVQRLLANGCSLEDAMHIFFSCEDQFSSGFFSLYELW